MEVIKLNKKVKKIWYIRNIIAIILISLLIIPTIFVGKPFVICTSIIVLIIDFFLLLWPKLKYENYKYGYDNKRISINYGVIFKHHVIIPIRQIQDLHTYNGPVMSLMKLSGIIISTAGSNFIIAGLDTSDAEQFISDLECLLNERLDGVGNEKIY